MVSNKWSSLAFPFLYKKYCLLKGQTQNKSRTSWLDIRWIILQQEGMTVKQGKMSFPFIRSLDKLFLCSSFCRRKGIGQLLRGRSYWRAGGIRKLKGSVRANFLHGSGYQTVAKRHHALLHPVSVPFERNLSFQSLKTKDRAMEMSRQPMM